MSEVKTNHITASIGAVPYTTTIKSGEFTLYADEPVNHGGAGKGPKSHDFLLSSLASCTCITMKMYATRKEWDLQEVVIDCKMERITESGVQQTSVVLKIAMKGNLDEKQKERLLFIAGRCPVHRTLHAAMKIDIIAA